MTKHAEDMADDLAAVGSHALYRSVFNVLHEAVVVEDRDGLLVLANAAASNLLGWGQADAPTRVPREAAWRLVHLDGSAVTPSELPSEVARLTSQAVSRRRLGLKQPDGTIRPLIVSSEPVTEGGRLRLVVTSLVDASTETADGTRSIIDAAPGVLFQWLQRRDGTETLLYLSEHARALMGHEPEVYLADPLMAWRAIHPDDAPKVRQAIAASARDLSPYAIDFRLRGPDDEWHWVQSQAVPRAIPEGVLWTGVFVRTADFGYAHRLRRSARREAMGELAAGLAHNFNNMLASILPNLELALTEPSLDSRPLLADALQASRNAADLVRQLLAFTRAETVESVKRAVDLSAVVRETLRFCRRTFGARIQIEDRVEPALFVLGQASNLQQVVLNLCMNARDAVSGCAQPRITVTLAADNERPSPRVRLTIADNGVGMTPQVLKRLGEPFFTTKAPGRGTGLGLATIYGMLSDIGATMACESQPNEGARFDVLFARHVPAEQDVTAPKGPIQLPRLSGLIMLIDDERLVRAALRRQLKAAGLDTIEAGTGDEALVLLNGMTRLPDAILLDLAMPGTSGEQILTELVQHWPHIPVIVVSGNRGPSQVLEGARTTLRKPFDVETLIATLEPLLQLD